MSIINPQKKEINCKIVYYGPALSGKTTSLKALQEKIRSGRKKGVVRQIPETERTLFFDFLGLSSTEDVNGYKTRFQIYTVPGQTLYEDARRLLLNGVDGIIFVADSSLEYIEDSIRSLKELGLNLRRLGYKPQDIPTVIQYNKRDAKTAAPVKELRKILNPSSLSDFETIATKGKGVLETFETLLSHVILDLKKAA